MYLQLNLYYFCNFIKVSIFNLFDDELYFIYHGHIHFGINKCIGTINAPNVCFFLFLWRVMRVEPDMRNVLGHAAENGALRPQ